MQKQTVRQVIIETLENRVDLLKKYYGTLRFYQWSKKSECRYAISTHEATLCHFRMKEEFVKFYPQYTEKVLDKIYVPEEDAELVELLATPCMADS